MNVSCVGPISACGRGPGGVRTFRDRSRHPFLDAEAYAGVDWLDDYGTIIGNTTSRVAYCLTMSAPDRDDQVRINRIQGRCESSPIHESFFDVLSSDPIFVGVRRRNAGVRVNHDQHSPRLENVCGQNLFLVFRGCERNRNQEQQDEWRPATRQDYLLGRSDQLK